MPMSPLTIPQWSMITALVMTVSGASALVGCACPSRPGSLAAAEDDLFAVGGEIVLDLDDQLRVG